VKAEREPVRFTTMNRRAAVSGSYRSPARHYCLPWRRRGFL